MVTPRKLRCEITQIIDHGHGVYTLEMRPEQRVPKFRPGQFLHLAIDPYEPGDFWPESRVFSIASSPAERERLSISYSVVGHFTGRMEREIYAGQLVWVKMPYGDFVIQDQRDIALIAGGTGITAFTAYLLSLDPQQRHPVHLFYGARDEELLIYRQAIDNVAASTHQIHVQYYADALTSASQSNSTDVTAGRPSAKSVLAGLAIPESTEFYLSGPPPMLSALTEQLRENGISADAIHIDAWGQVGEPKVTQ